MEPTMEAGLESAGGLKTVPGPVVQIDEGRIQAHLDEVVRAYPFGQLHTSAWYRAVLKCRDEHERIGCSEAQAEPDGSRASGL